MHVLKTLMAFWSLFTIAVILHALGNPLAWGATMGAALLLGMLILDIQKPKTDMEKAHAIQKEIDKLRDQQDQLLEKLAQALMQKIHDANHLDDLSILQTEINTFPNDGFYRSELRTAINQKKVQLGC